MGNATPTGRWWNPFAPGEDGAYCNSINQMNEYDDPSNDGLAPIPDDDGLPDDFMVEPCPPLPLGDFDDDGDVDMNDANVFVSVVLGTDNDPDHLDLADLTGDGLADGCDIGLLVQSMLGEPTPRSPDSGFNRAHDKNGNLVDDDTNEYFYDYDHRPIGTATLRAENRLTMVKEKGGADLGEYWYDALGRRIRELASGVSTVCVYTYSWRAIEEYENDALVHDYAHGYWVDDVLTIDRAVEADRFYYHANPLGSIIVLTDETGAPVERYAYGAYGPPAFADGIGTPAGQSTLTNPYLFTGRRYDPETGLYYYRTRYYGSGYGRFLTPDIIGTLGGINLYAYVNSAPTDLVDPTGMVPALVPILVGAERTAGVIGSIITFATLLNEPSPLELGEGVEKEYEFKVALANVSGAAQKASHNFKRRFRVWPRWYWFLFKLEAREWDSGPDDPLGYVALAKKSDRRSAGPRMPVTAVTKFSLSCERTYAGWYDIRGKTCVTIGYEDGSSYTACDVGSDVEIELKYKFKMWASGFSALLEDNEVVGVGNVMQQSRTQTIEAKGWHTFLTLRCCEM